MLRFSTRPFGKKIPDNINRIASVFTWACYVRELSPDVISGHDIIGLLIGWISTWFMSSNKKPRLIYDSHEFEIGRNTRRNGIQTWSIKHLERFLLKRCAFSIMVNDVIADEVQRIHKLKERPVVVRSTPSLWQIDESVTHNIHAMFCNMFGVPQDSFIVMYHGAVMSGRGVEMLIRLVSLNTNIYAVILGNGEDSYMGSLKRCAEISMWKTV